ncbi:heme oxygenase-like, multi-helical [Phytophthora cactorum]|nr:heme oxygenase-like, multi-helical [Phytophthora cactorum]
MAMLAGGTMIKKLVKRSLAPPEGEGLNCFAFDVKSNKVDFCVGYTMYSLIKCNKYTVFTYDGVCGRYFATPSRRKLMLSTRRRDQEAHSRRVDGLLQDEQQVRHEEMATPSKFLVDGLVFALYGCSRLFEASRCRKLRSEVHCEVAHHHRSRLVELGELTVPYYNLDVLRLAALFHPPKLVQPYHIVALPSSLLCEYLYSRGEIKCAPRGIPTSQLF